MDERRRPGARLICRASCDQGLPEGASEAERPHYDEWRAITADKGLRIVVDIIAGTSAGGLNGTILGTALACGKSLPDLKEIWNRSAALTPEALLWPTGDDPVPSVLNGSYFETTVGKVLRGLCAEPRPVDRDVTLFVTATALGRSDLRYRDSAEEEFDVADHRRLYRFRTAEVDRFDPGADESFQRVRENDFTDGHDAVEALVHATRASASYPAAFEPVEETKELAARRHPPAAPAAETGQRGTAYLMDGGILDNAPIEPVIEEVGRRSVDGKVRRVLAYVVPSNGISPRVTPAPSAGAPNWTSVVAAALDLPRSPIFGTTLPGSSRR